MKLRRILLSWDIWLALFASIVLGWCLPQWAPSELAKDYYGIGIAVLSIIFSVFLAALVVIISASDDDFIAFLEETGAYSAIVANFRFSLRLLFFAMIYSLVFYAYTAARIASTVRHQTKYFLIVFCFLFLWSLFATFNSTEDAIIYRKYRQKFTEAQQKSKDPRT
jgi:hypothetical protein